MKKFKLSMTPLRLVPLLFVTCTPNAFASSTVEINIDVQHEVGAKSTFDRRKYMTVHSSNSENDWIGEDDKKHYLMNNLDVYFARETGSMRYNVNQVNEDPNRTGFASPSHMITVGNGVKTQYANTLDSKNTRKFEQREFDIVTAAQQEPFYPGSAETAKGWEFSNANPFGHSTGEFMGRFIRDFFGTGGSTGRPTPKYVELMNEPIWPLVEHNLHGGGTIDDIFEFHRAAATEIKKISPKTKVGGFTTAFPELEQDNFSQWDERWKYFMDSTGSKMDFYSLHLYDLPTLNGKNISRTGANIEATLDMIEHYGVISNKKNLSSYLNMALRCTI